MALCLSLTPVAHWLSPSLPPLLCGSLCLSPLPLWLSLSLSLTSVAHSVSLRCIFGSLCLSLTSVVLSVSLFLPLSVSVTLFLTPSSQQQLSVEASILIFLVPNEMFLRAAGQCDRGHQCHYRSNRPMGDRNTAAGGDTISAT